MPYILRDTDPELSALLRAGGDAISDRSKLLNSFVRLGRLSEALLSYHPETAEILMEAIIFSSRVEE